MEPVCEHPGNEPNVQWGSKAQFFDTLTDTDRLPRKEIEHGQTRDHLYRPVGRS